MNNSKIIGQDILKKEIKRIFDIFINSECKIRPHFILTGESGSGKTHTIKVLAKAMQCQFLEINAAQLTKEGTSGNSCSKALSPLLNFSNAKPTIVFVDEFDKLFISGNSNSDFAHETTNGVQNEFLKIVESDVTAVFGDYGKYINVSTSNILYVFAGAFNGEKDIDLDRLREMGVKTEFLGRVGLVYNTKPLTLEDYYSIIDNSDLLRKYCILFEEDFEKISSYIKGYMSRHYENNTIGARLINTIINQYFIKSGELEKKDEESIAFTKKLKL